MLSLYLALLSTTISLDAATAALAEFRVEEALRLLERAKTEGPYRYADHVRLYEQLGIALAYAGRNEEAIAAFDHMLAIDPAHALSYSLSPKATLPFERARQRAIARPAPGLDLALPRGKETHDPLPIDLDVLADPFRFLATAKIFYRAQPEAWKTIEVALDDPSRRHRAVLPPISPREAAAVVEIYVVVEDRRRNEVMLLGTEQKPREIPLSYTPPEPWYERWWVWTTAGVLIAGGATTAVLLATQNEDPTISGRVIREP
jgi:tetratricopeptide (TPR) repeat protein